MNDGSLEIKHLTISALSVNQVLRRLDLAAEVLEGLDELGANSRSEVVALMNKLERLLDDET